ncbi:elongation factor P hydroxylase [Gammaproteobacteria bacterium]|nr:elongation factor P hydroxylase [Gammaproteobacteria bacterium]
MSIIGKLNVIVIIESIKLAVINEIFAAEFSEAFAIELIGGAEEPLYLPAGPKSSSAKIFYRRDYLASALHEVAHWCIAGKARRAMEDFGYWYNPDGRSAAQQNKFELAEVKPQALEWMFSVACKKPFQVSTDNLTGNGQGDNAMMFRLAVMAQAQRWCLCGEMPVRGLQFLHALMDYYEVDARCTEHYKLKHLA